MNIACNTMTVSNHAPVCLKYRSWMFHVCTDFFDNKGHMVQPCSSHVRNIVNVARLVYGFNSTLFFT